MADYDATDAAKAHADEQGVDLSKVEGTGEDGRITADDVDRFENEGGATAADVEVEPVTAEDQAEDAAAALEAHGIDADELYAKEAVLPPTAQPSGGVIPPVEEQVGPPLTVDQLQQLAEQQAATAALAERAGKTETEKVSPPESPAPEDADNPEPEEQVEPNPVEALAARKAESDEGPLPGSAEQRQRDGASEASARTPLLQRPAEDQTGHATAQHAAYQEGDTLPGERDLENDAPAYQVAVNHVPGTPLPDEYYESAGPAPQPTSNPKRTQEELDALNGDKEDDD